MPDIVGLQLERASVPFMHLDLPIMNFIDDIAILNLKKTVFGTALNDFLEH